MAEDIRWLFTLELNRQHEGFNGVAMETILQSNDLILSGGLTAVKADSDIEFAKSCLSYTNRIKDNTTEV